MIGMIFIAQFASLVDCVLGCDGDENSAEQLVMHTHQRMAPLLKIKHSLRVEIFGGIGD
jgi:hypothetical protein